MCVGLDMTWFSKTWTGQQQPAQLTAADTQHMHSHDMRRQCSSMQMQSMTHMTTLLLPEWLWRWHLLLLLLSPRAPHSDLWHQGHCAIGGLEARGVHTQRHLCSMRVHISVQTLSVTQ